MWDENRRDEGKAVNGIVIRMDWREKIVFVYFYAIPGREAVTEEYEFDDFKYCWTRRFRGGWRLSPHGPPIRVLIINHN